MIKIVSLLLQVVGVGAGVYLGLWLKAGSPDAPNAGSEESTQTTEKTKAANAKADEKKEKNNKKDGHGEDSGDNGDLAFMKFSRQFIVPVVQSNGVNALVMLDINLEVSPSATDIAYAQEPKVRDALLSTLLQLSTEGAFNARFTDQGNMDAVRGRLLQAAKTVLHEDVHEVLILSIARQNI